MIGYIVVAYSSQEFIVSEIYESPDDAENLAESYRCKPGYTVNIYQRQTVKEKPKMPILPRSTMVIIHAGGATKRYNEPAGKRRMLNPMDFVL